MSAGFPNRWTGMTTAVFSLTRRSTLAGSMFIVSGSTSAKTGVPPAFTTAPAVATNVNDGRMTSRRESGRSSSTARSARKSASVHESTATARSTPM